MEKLISLILVLFFALSGHAVYGQSHALYAGMIQNKGYFVGSELQGAGLAFMDERKSWQHIGFNIPRVFAVAYHPHDPDILYLACGNGLMRTADRGEKWRILTDWRHTEVLDVALEPTNPNHIYIATAYGIWKSENGGADWSEMMDGIEGRYIQVLEVDRERPGRILAGAESGLYESVDGGNSWSLISALEDVMDVQQSVSNPDFWLVGFANNGLLYSHDGGKNWEHPRASVEQTFYAVAINPINAREMAAAGWDTKIWISGDGGTRWSQIGDELPTDDFYEIIFDPEIEGRLWASTVEEGLFYTDPGTDEWHAAGMEGTLVFDLVFIPE